MKALGVMVNILGTPCYNTEFVGILVKLLKLKIVLKQVKQGVSLFGNL